MALWLSELGAKVTGFALAPESDAVLFDQLEIGDRVENNIGNINDFDSLKSALNAAAPDIVFHLAAQSLVLRSYSDPLETWQTNVMGTANVLEALRQVGRPATVIAITTDKVYRNLEMNHAYSEDDALGGVDPYSASKAGSELVIGSFRALYEQANLPIRLASARAGNVIGGGDWCENRIVPDIVRSLITQKALETRNPRAVRPWQHVLEPIAGYMALAEALHADADFAQPYNFGPNISDNRTVEDLIQEALKSWNGTYRATGNAGLPHEAGLLKLDISKATSNLDWHPRWGFEEAVAKTMEWYRSVEEGANPVEQTLAQIAEFSKS
jgi:CDP-glucose 4,6-dehydratase